MSTLLLRLAAPLQAWGVDSKFDTRTTAREPTKSGVIGLLAAALGIRRDDIAALKALSALRFGVRVEREGKYLNDFHMVHEEEFWKKREGKYSHVTHRYYLSDAVFLCGLEHPDRRVLERYAYALTHPVFPLFLGRRSCPPTLPLVLGIRDEKLLDVLRTEPRCDGADGAMRIVYEVEPEDRTAAAVKDVPESFSPFRREYGYRKIRETIIGQQTEHDPFAELEAEDVSDENGA